MPRFAALLHACSARRLLCRRASFFTWRFLALLFNFLGHYNFLPMIIHIKSLRFSTLHKVITTVHLQSFYANLATRLELVVLLMKVLHRLLQARGLIHAFRVQSNRMLKWSVQVHLGSLVLDFNYQVALFSFPALFVPLSQTFEVPLRIWLLVALLLALSQGRRRARVVVGHWGQARLQCLIARALPHHADRLLDTQMWPNATFPIPHGRKPRVGVLHHRLYFTQRPGLPVSTSELQLDLRILLRIRLRLVILT